MVTVLLSMLDKVFPLFLEDVHCTCCMEEETNLLSTRLLDTRMLLCMSLIIFRRYSGFSLDCRDYVSLIIAPMLNKAA